MPKLVVLRGILRPPEIFNPKTFFRLWVHGLGACSKSIRQIFVFLTSFSSDWIASANSRVCLRHRQKEGRYGPPNWGNFGGNTKTAVKNTRGWPKILASRLLFNPGGPYNLPPKPTPYPPPKIFGGESKCRTLAPKFSDPTRQIARFWFKMIKTDRPERMLKFN